MKSEDGLTGSISTEKGFGGYRVVAFEARFAQEMAKLIASHGGEPLVAPAMAEVPLGQNVSAFEFAERLFRGELPVVVFLTGVGTRTVAGPRQCDRRTSPIDRQAVVPWPATPSQPPGLSVP